MKKKNVKAAGKARKLEAPGPSLVAQITTKDIGNLSFGGRLNLDQNATEDAIDAYLMGSKNSAIRAYFDAQLERY